MAALAVNLDQPIREVGTAVGQFNAVTTQGLQQIAARVAELKRANTALTSDKDQLTATAQRLQTRISNELEPAVARLTDEGRQKTDETRLAKEELASEKRKSEGLERQNQALLAALEKATRELAALKATTEQNTGLVGRSLEAIFDSLK